jgi:transcriptional regulator with XRE-family HTH domain
MTKSELALLIEGRTAASTGRGERLREAAGLNQSELARLVGVTPAALNRWEAGARTPSGESAVAYAKALRKIAQEIAAHV